MQNKKLFVVGLDGLSFNILDQIRNDYDLININAVLEKGAYGPLRSVLPYSSAPNWASITTGVNPGKHGFYSFFFPKNNGYEYQFPNSTYVKVSRVWDIIGRMEKKVLVANVPGTYPPHKVNGCMVTGMLTPEMKSDFSSPSSLAAEIRDKFPDYSFDTNWTKYQDIGLDQLIEALLISVRNRRDLFFYLLDKYPVDFTMLVFTETDRLFHSALHLIDKNHPYFDRKTYERNKDKIIEIFKIIDDAVGRIMNNHLDNGNLILLSDHGFTPMLKKVYLNNWLSEQKLFDVQGNNDVEKKAYLFKSLARAILGMLNISGKKRARFQARLLSFLRENKGLPLFGSISKTVINIADSLSRTNWSKTKAYYLQEWGIRINLKGREPQGIVEKHEYENVRDEIIRSIMSFRNPDNKKLIFKKALKREEACFGEEFENAPDIFLITEDMPGYELTSDTLTKNIFGSIEWKTGDHSLFGMFSVMGENVQTAQLNNISVNDVVPTILYTLGLPIPNHIDGKVIKQVFAKDYQDNHKVNYDSGMINKSVEKKEFAKQDEETIKDRLKGLGYF